MYRSKNNKERRITPLVSFRKVGKKFQFINHRKIQELKRSGREQDT